jgi:peptide/nickel transport system substrate-binding protein
VLASKPKRWMRSLALVFTLFLFCGWVPRAAGRDLIIGHSGTVSHLDPHFSRPTGHSHIYSNLYDTLVTRNHQLDLVPGLAMSWTLLDAQTWQFRLRQGVVFHNGHALTAEDVKFSLERAAHEQPCSSVFTSLNSISHVRILDSPTVNVVTRWPDPQLPARLSSNGGMILPGDYFEELGMERFSRQPIGTGPLKFVAWREDAGIIFEGNRQYWRPPAPYARVIFKAYPPPPHA